MGWQFGLAQLGVSFAGLSCVGSVADRLGGSASERVGWGLGLLARTCVCGPHHPTA